MIGNDYEIISVEPTEPPNDMEGSDWYRYVIAQGANKIRGYRQGSRRSVTKSVEEIVRQLNERRFGKRGRVHIDMSSKGKPAKAK